MKKTILILLAALLVMTLLTGCGKTDPIDGIFYAATCTDGDDDYGCIGEYIELNEDGTGVILYNDEEYTLTYTYSESSGDFSFRDENNVRFEGRFDGDSITGEYGDTYEYLYVTIGAGKKAELDNTYRAVRCEMDGESVYCGDDELVLEQDGTGTATLDGETRDMIWLASGGSFCMYGDGFSMIDGEIDDGEIRGEVFGAEYVFSCNAPAIELGQYGATECTDADDDGYEYFLDGEYIVLEEDGTGTFNFIGNNYDIEWTLDGSTFSFVDEDDDTFEGTYADGVIDGVYLDKYHYVFEFGAEPSTDDRLSPGQYGATLCTDPDDYSAEYYLDGEYIYLYNDGTGAFGFLDNEYDFEYACEGNEFAFKVDDDHMFYGTYEDDTIDGTLLWGDDLYRYVFEYGAEPTLEERDTADSDDYNIEDYTADLPAGTYGATACTDPDDYSLEYYMDGEYMVLNSDGTGVFYFGAEYDIYWACMDGVFMFEDEDGDEFVGTYTSDGVIEGVYMDNYRYVLEYGAQPYVDSRD